MENHNVHKRRWKKERKELELKLCSNKFSKPATFQTHPIKYSLVEDAPSRVYKAPINKPPTQRLETTIAAFQC